MSEDYIKFLGTAGARIVMIKQLRYSGGVWLSLEGVNILLDPGPGTLFRCIKSRPPLDPTKLDAILLSHKHIDHSNDVNLMIEAMTEGGFKKKGKIFCPPDAINPDGVILKYAAEYVERLQLLEEGGKYWINSLSFCTPIKHIHHGVCTFGFVFFKKGTKICFISDTRYFDALTEAYKGASLLIMNVVRKESSELDHLCIKDVERLILGIRPKIAIITHFGRTVLTAGPQKLAQLLTDSTGTQTIAAYDGMSFSLDTLC
jgi:ribonuclease BN (tRNA processing enzyme)